MVTMELPSAKPYAFKFTPSTTALVLIDMQRDFLNPGGFGDIQCGNPSKFAQVRSILPAVQRLLSISRQLNLHIFHTREGHTPTLSDLPPSKALRQISAPNGHHTLAIGDHGPNGRLLIRGEWGHDIVDELTPLPGEVIIDKPGKGSFWDTKFHRALLARGVTHVLFCGVTTECCVSTTCREAADRGFECCVLGDCTAGFDDVLVKASLDSICAYDGLFGFVGSSRELELPAVSSVPELPEWKGNLLPIKEMQTLYRTGKLDPITVINSIYDKIEKYETSDPAVWISRQTREECIEAAKTLQEKYPPNSLPPLYGIPFAVKDNIDITGIQTTAACPCYAYTPTNNAPVVQNLLDAGAIYIGKTNMDQLATGLSGCRSPYGTPHSFYSPTHISGGSSSGSAVAVSASLVSFSLGTDTAGSGRVPAAFNGIVGFKPTIGTLSARGVVPACASLDTVSIMAKDIRGAREVWYVLDQNEPDLQDPYSKPKDLLPFWKTDFRGARKGGFKFGVPSPEALKMCSPQFQELFNSAISKIQKCGGELVDIDFTPFTAASDLLYNASLVNERISCIGPEFLKSNLTTLHPTTRAIFESAFAKDVKAWDVFRDKDLQRKYTREAQILFDSEIDVLVVPSTPFHPTIQEMIADPLGLNAKVGEFTHFGNVLDLCGVSVNADWYAIPGGEGKLPFGITFLGGMGRDGRVLDIAGVFEEEIAMAV